uniref:PPM-type phosphatase domain-containing protein n=2 Tax=Gloeothece TaxID=28070 RepID=E0UJD9_GLOV7|nr:conserved hypothetical protein [Gloeothece verrucosa PCC 7822]
MVKKLIEKLSRAEGMAEKPEAPKWRIIQETVQGANRKLDNIPNQDAISVWQPSPLELPLILALSDGYRSPKSFRRQMGSQLAVKTALLILQEFVNYQPNLDHLRAFNTLVIDKLPQQLVTTWKKAVQHHLQEHPFSVEDLQNVAAKEGFYARQALEHNPFLAYGATLNAVLVTQEFILYLQLGNGDIICIDNYGAVTQPFLKDERDELKSLSFSNAWTDFHVRLIPLAPDKTPMILVATNSYAASYQTEAEFLQAVKNYLFQIRSQGCDTVQKNLNIQLEQISQQGRGDDISLGIIKKIDDRDIVDNLKLLKQTLAQEQNKTQKIKHKIDFMSRNI